MMSAHNAVISPRLHEISTYRSSLYQIPYYSEVLSSQNPDIFVSCKVLPNTCLFESPKVRARHFQLTSLVASDNLNLTSQALKWRTLIRNRKTPVMEWLLKFLSALAVEVQADTSYSQRVVSFRNSGFCLFLLFTARKSSIISIMNTISFWN